MVINNPKSRRQRRSRTPFLSTYAGSPAARRSRSWTFDPIRTPIAPPPLPPAPDELRTDSSRDQCNTHAPNTHATVANSCPDALGTRRTRKFTLWFTRQCAQLMCGHRRRRHCETASEIRATKTTSRVSGPNTVSKKVRAQKKNKNKNSTTLYLALDIGFWKFAKIRCRRRFFANGAIRAKPKPRTARVARTLKPLKTRSIDIIHIPRLWLSPPCNGPFASWRTTTAATTTTIPAILVPTTPTATPAFLSVTDAFAPHKRENVCVRRLWYGVVLFFFSLSCTIMLCSQSSYLALARFPFEHYYHRDI